MKPELESEIRSFFPHPHRAIACLATVDANRGFSPEARPINLLELGWRFYVATGAGTRKAREMAIHPRVAALVMFRKENCAGYLRVCGRAEPVADFAERQRIADAACYSLEGCWKGAGDPALSFFRIAPERIEYMRPGDDDAKDVTADLAGGAAR
jgi:general stress protein 26